MLDTRKVLCSLMGWAWMAIALAGVPETPRFRVIGVGDGLPSSSINVIARDHAGYLWLATPDGLARYDGIGVRIWRHDPGNRDGLPANNVQALHVDAQDRVWVATGCACTSSRLRAPTAWFHLASPRSNCAIGIDTCSCAVVQSSGSNSSVPVLPDTVPNACEKPAWLTANSTRVCTGSSA